MKQPFLLVGVALLLAGCRSAPAPRPDSPSRSIVLLTPEQARHHGYRPGVPDGEPVPAGAPALSTAAVVGAAEVKAYAVGRTVDPRDPALLHETHVVYRRETSPRWRLQAPTDQRILIGPQLTDGKQDLQPLLTKELTAFLHEQRRAAQANEEAVAALFKTVQRLAEQQRVLVERSAPVETKEEPQTAGAGVTAEEQSDNAKVKED